MMFRKNSTHRAQSLQVLSPISMEMRVLTGDRSSKDTGHLTGRSSNELEIDRPAKSAAYW